MARLIGYANRVNLKSILRAVQDAQREEKSKGPLIIFLGAGLLHRSYFGLSVTVATEAGHGYAGTHKLVSSRRKKH